MGGADSHIQAEQAREQGNFVDALKFTDEAIVAYQQEGNYAKLAEVLASRALTFRHLFEKTSDKNFLHLAKYSAKAAVKICEENANSSKTIPLYTLGKVYESLEKYDKASEKIKEAIDTADETTSKTALSEMKTRLDAINYRLGDTSAFESFNADITDLENGEFSDDYVKNVWVSGAYMHMASSFILRGEKEKASDLLSKARAIVEADSRLSLRSKQVEKLESQIK